MSKKCIKIDDVVIAYSSLVINVRCCWQRRCVYLFCILCVKVTYSSNSTGMLDNQNGRKPSRGGTTRMFVPVAAITQPCAAIGQFCYIQPTHQYETHSFIRPEI